MEFTQLKRRNEYKPLNTHKFDNTISVRFYKPPRLTKYYTFIVIGKSICEKIGLNDGDRVVFSYGTYNPRIWFIKKTIETDNDGYKIYSQKRAGRAGRALKFRIISLPYAPQEFEKEIRHVRYDFYEGGLRIFSEESFDKDEGL